VTFNDTVPIT